MIFNKKELRAIWDYVTSMKSYQGIINEDSNSELISYRQRLEGLEVAFDNLVDYLKLDYNDDCVFEKRKKKK